MSGALAAQPIDGSLAQRLATDDACAGTSDRQVCGGAVCPAIAGAGLAASIHRALNLRQGETIRRPRRRSPGPCIARCRTDGTGWRAHRCCPRCSWGNARSGSGSTHLLAFPILQAWLCRLFWIDQASRTQCQFEVAIVAGRVQPVIRFLAHEPDRHHQPIAADLWNHVQG